MPSNPSEAYDFLVIGGGSAGYAAARTAVDLGLRTAVVDGSRTLGGLCILRGCMPSKTLIETADRFRAIRHAGEFGLSVGAAEASAPDLIARKRRLIGEFADYRQGQLEDGRFDLFRGSATFLSPHTVRVTPTEGVDGGPGHLAEPCDLEFSTACIASGSVISIPSFDGLDACGYLTSDEVLDLETLPDSIVVLGGGAIALEMACYFEGMGRKVTVIQRSPHVLTGSDHDIADALTDAMRERGIEVFTGTTLRHFEKSESGGKTVHFDHQGQATHVTADELLVALGRHPNTAPLHVDAAGVRLNRHHVDASETMATCAPHIFAAGDVCGPYEVVHTAIEQGEIAAHNAAVLLGKASTPRTIDYRLKLYGIFTHPAVGTVGMTELEAAEAGREIRVARYPFDDHGKSMVRGETAGFVKMIADAESGELLGAAVIGPEAAELIHELSVALYFRCTARQFLEIPHYHPTLSEIWTYPADELAEAQPS